MLTSSQIDEFHCNGFLNGGRVLTDRELDALRADLDHILEKGPRRLYQRRVATGLVPQHVPTGRRVRCTRCLADCQYLGSVPSLWAADLPPIHR